MFDMMKKALLAGVGMTLLTKDRVEEMARDIASSAEMSAEKGEEFVAEAVKRAERSREELEVTIRRVVEDTVKKTNLPTRDEFNQLVARVEALERRAESPNA